MKKLHKIILFLGIAIFGFSSCLDVVEFDPTNRYTSKLAFDSEQNVKLYLNSFYPILQSYSQFGGAAMGGNSTMSDGLTDILKYGGIVPGVGDANLIMTVENYVSASANPFNTWSGGYVWIRKINEFLNGLNENKSKFGANAEKFEAEARFFRAYVYFLMMRSHVSDVDNLGIVIHDDINTMTVNEKNKARSSVSDSWDFIEQDLAFCVSGDRLALVPAEDGRVSYYAAQALTARAMLYARRYDKAIAAARTIQNKFSYIDEYANVFKNIRNTEVILGVYWKYPDLTHSFDLKYAPAGDVLGQGLQALAGPTQEFVDMYDMADGTAFDLAKPEHGNIRFVNDVNVSQRDPRLKATVLYNDTQWKDRKLKCYFDARTGNYEVDMKNFPYSKVNSPGNTITGYYMRKFVDESNLDFITKGSFQSWPEFRYAETMLILAECLAQKPATMEESKDILLALRQKRFKSTTLARPLYSTTDQAVDYILKERCVELAFEGHRFWDLRRTGRAVQLLNGKRYNAVKWTKHADGSFTAELVSADTGIRRYYAKYDAFPIPESEVRNNTLANQNNNW